MYTTNSINACDYIAQLPQTQVTQVRRNLRSTAPGRYTFRHHRGGQQLGAEVILLTDVDFFAPRSGWERCKATGNRYPYATAAGQLLGIIPPMDKPGVLKDALKAAALFGNCLEERGGAQHLHHDWRESQFFHYTYGYEIRDIHAAELVFLSPSINLVVPRKWGYRDCTLTACLEASGLHEYLFLTTP